MGWILSLIIVIAAGLFIKRLKGQHQEATRALEAQAKLRVEALEEAMAAQHKEQQAQLGRLERETQQTRQRGHLGLAVDLLPGLDALERAHELALADKDQAKLADGLGMIRAELERALERHEIIRVAPAPGESFNPKTQEAVATTETTDDAQHNTIAASLRSGWTHPSRQLRPAMVQVMVRPSQVKLDFDSPEPPAGDEQAAQLVLDHEGELALEEEPVGVSASSSSASGSSAGST